MSFDVGLRDGTLAANNIGSNGTSAFVFFSLSFIRQKHNRF
jgi:hypothetical protein